MSATPPATYAELRAVLRAEGCFDRAPALAALALVGNLVAAGAAYLAAFRGPAALAPIAFVLGAFFFHRLGWLMHDAAHGNVFDSPRANRAFAYVVCAILGEFLSGWRYGHDLHHAFPNVRGKDRDKKARWDPRLRFRTRLGAFLGVLVFVRVGPVQLPRMTLLMLVRDGAYCLRSRPHLFVPELVMILASHAAQLGFFVALGGAPGVLAYLAHSLLGMLYLNLVFAGNHYDLPSFDEAEGKAVPFDELQIRTARNYDLGWLSRFVCGGLEHQIEHHLFPLLPRRGLRRAAPHVAAYCRTRGLPYEVLSLAAATHRVLDYHLDAERAPALEP